MSFFFNDTATTEIYTLSLHDALPISRESGGCPCRESSPPAHRKPLRWRRGSSGSWSWTTIGTRSEEHTSELQSLAYLVCRLLLEKKKAHAFSFGQGRR